VIRAMQAPVLGMAETVGSAMGLVERRGFGSGAWLGEAPQDPIG
jgi:hypothetical protein